MCIRDSHKSVSVKSVSRDRLICGFHNSCTGIDSYYFRRKTVFIGCQVVYGINVNILWYDQSDTCFSINRTEFELLNILLKDLKKILAALTHLNTHPCRPYGNKPVYRLYS